MMAALDLAAVRKRHQRGIDKGGDSCMYCSDTISSRAWPCDAIQLVERVEALELGNKILLAQIEKAVAHITSERNRVVEVLRGLLLCPIKGQQIDPRTWQAAFNNAVHAAARAILSVPSDAPSPLEEK